MIDSIVFLNQSFLWPILIGAMLLLLVFLWKEWAQAGKRRFPLKAVLAFLSVASLTLIALKPALPGDASARKMLLLTQGYFDQQLDSLQKEHRKIKTFNYNPGQILPANLISAEKVFIAGHGIKDYDLWQLDGVPAVYLGGKPPAGVVRLNYGREQEVGNRLELKGLYRNPEAGNRLVLQEPGGTAVDSVILRSEGEQAFRLSVPLKVTGNYVFSLAEKDSTGTLISEDPLPVQVTEKENLKILVLNSFPTFETRYLKNFLAETGHMVVVRSQLTRGRFKYEYLNTDPFFVGSLTENTLETFDLLLVDAASLRSLSGNQTKVIENSVREKGLGIFLQADDNFFTINEKLNPFTFERVNAIEMSLDEWQDIIFSRFPFRINRDFGVQEIHTADNQIASAYKRLGKGRIGVSVISNTYYLPLEGKKDVYRQFWTRALEQVAAKDAPAASLEQETDFLYPNEPFHFKVRTTLKDPEIRTENHRIPLMQDFHFPEVWQGTTWPQQEGWNSLYVDTIATLDFYVAGKDSWSSLSAVKTIEANRRYFRTQPPTGEMQQPLELVNPLWFFVLFLISIGGLWLEPKL